MSTSLHAPRLRIFLSLNSDIAGGLVILYRDLYGTLSGSQAG